MILDQPTEGCDLYTRTMIRDFIAANKAGRWERLGTKGRGQKIGGA